MENNKYLIKKYNDSVMEIKIKNTDNSIVIFENRYFTMLLDGSKQEPYLIDIHKRAGLINGIDKASDSDVKLICHNLFMIKAMTDDIVKIDTDHPFYSGTKMALNVVLKNKASEKTTPKTTMLIARGIDYVGINDIYYFNCDNDTLIGVPAMAITNLLHFKHKFVRSGNAVFKIVESNKPGIVASMVIDHEKSITIIDMDGIVYEDLNLYNEFHVLKEYIGNGRTKLNEINIEDDGMVRFGFGIDNSYSIFTPVIDLLMGAENIEGAIKHDKDREFNCIIGLDAYSIKVDVLLDDETFTFNIIGPLDYLLKIALNKAIIKNNK